MPSVSSAQPLREAAVAGSCCVPSPMGLRNWKASISPPCAGPALCDSESAWHPEIPTHDGDSLHSWQMCASTAWSLRGGCAGWGSFPAQIQYEPREPSTLAYKHCVFPQHAALQDCRTQRAILLGRHVLWSLSSSVKWAISEDLVFIFFSGLECFLCYILEYQPQKNRCLLCCCGSRHRKSAVSHLLLLHNQHMTAGCRPCGSSFFSLLPSGREDVALPQSYLQLQGNSYPPSPNHRVLLTMIARGEGRPVVLETSKNDLGHNNEPGWNVVVEAFF